MVLAEILHGEAGRPRSAQRRCGGPPRRDADCTATGPDSGPANGLLGRSVVCRSRRLAGAAAGAGSADYNLPFPIPNDDTTAPSRSRRRPRATKPRWPSWSAWWPRWKAASCRSSGLLEGYRRGAELLAVLSRPAEAVEQQVKVLEDGQLKPWTAWARCMTAASDFDRLVLELERASSMRASRRRCERWVPRDAPAGLGEAMRYGVLDGGKRLRPLLVLAAARGGARQPRGGAARRPARSS